MSLTSHARESRKWLLKAGGCLTEVNISNKKINVWEHLFGCLRQVGCLIEVTANTGLTDCIQKLSYSKPAVIPA